MGRMKTKRYNAIRRVSPQLRRRIEDALDTKESYSGCYFWTNTGSASNRRQQEQRFAAENEPFEIETKKGLIRVEPTLEISCKNFYFSMGITRDGEKSTVTVLKSLIK
jgi:hypothetical protein